MRISKMLVPAAALAAFALCSLASTASAGVLFTEDFEGDLSAWTGKSGGAHNGQIVTDPLDGSNSALNFTAINSAGDMFTATAFPVGVGAQLRLTFDYLGTVGQGESGGYVGHSAGLPGTHTWLIATGSVSGAQPLLQTNGSWATYSIDFASNYASMRVMLEDFVAPAGNAYFDNFRLETVPAVPLPPAAWMGLSLLAGAGLLARRRRNG